MLFSGSLETWIEATNQPLNESIGWEYSGAQVLFDAIERAGTLDGEQVNQALRDTNMMTIRGLVKFDEHHCNRHPIAFGQWVKTDNPWVWEHQVVFSEIDYLPVEHDPIFPVPCP